MRIQTQGPLGRLQAIIRERNTLSLKKKLSSIPLDIPTSSFSQKLSRKEILREIAHSPQHKKLYQAALQIEAYFLEQVFKEMRKPLFSQSLLPKSLAQKIFEDMLWQERSLKASENQELGLAEEIYSQYRDFA